MLVSCEDVNESPCHFHMDHIVQMWDAPEVEGGVVIQLSNGDTLTVVVKVDDKPVLDNPTAQLIANLNNLRVSTLGQTVTQAVRQGQLQAMQQAQQMAHDAAIAKRVGSLKHGLS